jgi:DNA modification methylase
MLGPYELNRVHIGDCRSLGEQIPDGSIDLIFTDPPYLKEYLYLYEWLAKWSARVLKPSGFLLVYTGGYWKDEIMSYMRQELEYFWDYSLFATNEAPMIWPRLTIARVKSLLCYRLKGSKALPRTTVLGSYFGGGKAKHYHDWQQDEETARYYIDCFTQVGDLVVDPFIGGGTTTAVCKVMGRQIVGFEIDPEAANVATKRMEATRQLVYQLPQVPVPEVSQASFLEGTGTNEAARD